MGLVNRVVPVDELMHAAETIAKKIANLPQAAARRNKALVNRVYLLAGFREALAYRDNPAIAATLESAHGDQVGTERRKQLSEGSWSAFKEYRGNTTYQKEGT
jgi:enoyl-CoA hydratase/carnithine racemase